MYKKNVLITMLVIVLVCGLFLGCPQETEVPKELDTTPPAEVSSVVKKVTSEKVLFTWTNPTDEDFAGVQITIWTASSQQKDIKLEKNETSFEIDDVIQGNYYIVTIKTFDLADNYSKGKIETFRIQTVTAEISNITLNRTHLDTLMTNRDILVTITGSDFSSIKNLKVQVSDETSEYDSVSAQIDTQTNTATATIQAPIPENLTDEGQKYIVKVFVDDNQSALTTEFIVSKPAVVTSMSIASVLLGTDNEVTVKVWGKNFDIRPSTQIKLFEKNSEIPYFVTDVPLENNVTDKRFTVTIPVPEKAGIYTVVAYYNGVKNDVTGTLEVFDVPQITEIEMPLLVGESYAGKPLPVKIKGKNFIGLIIKEKDFFCTNSTLSNLEFIVNDDFTDYTEATAQIVCPSKSTNIAIGYGNSFVELEVKVVKAEKCFTVGDIILTDKTKVSIEDIDTYTINENNKPVGVIASAPYGGATAKLLGLVEIAYKKWAKEGTTGYETYFEEIECYPTVLNKITSFTGDTEGYDNWNSICKIDPEGTLDAETNYPLFYFANNYGKDNDLVGSYFENEWFIPSIAELCEVYLVKDTLLPSLEKAGSNSKLSSNYWSSSERNLLLNGVGILEFWEEKSSIIATSSYKSNNTNKGLVLHLISAALE